MHSMRHRRRQSCRPHTMWRQQRARLEMEAWDRTSAVGREFGSPDFDRLMEKDCRDRAGVFNPVPHQSHSALSNSRYNLLF